MNDNNPKYPGQAVTGQTARAYALAAGDPYWMYVCEYVIPLPESELVPV